MGLYGYSDLPKILICRVSWLDSAILAPASSAGAFYFGLKLMFNHFGYEVHANICSCPSESLKITLHGKS
jgi:hypothetical protein